MKPLRVLGLLLVATASLAQTQQKSYELPTQDRLQLLLTQSDRAITQYEQAIKLESQGGAQLEQSAKADEDSLRKTREILEPLKKSPDAFNSPVGFLIVTGLDDASRNMALCMGQAGMQSALLEQAGKYADAQRLLQIGQTCLDASTLLYTVSESAVDVYGRYLLAEHAMTQDLSKSLGQCSDIIENGCKKR